MKQHHLYRHFDANGVLLYVGVTNDPKLRLVRHKAKSHWFNLIANITCELQLDLNSALDNEFLAIKNESPLYNIRTNRGCDLPGVGRPDKGTASAAERAAKFADEFGVTDKAAAKLMGVTGGAVSTWRKSNHKICPACGK